jgi:hypothetical protein
VPRFFLHHVVRGSRIEDVDGCMFDDATAAEWEAVLNIRFIVGYGLLGGGTISDGHVESSTKMDASSQSSGIMMP